MGNDSFSISVNECIVLDDMREGWLLYVPLWLQREGAAVTGFMWDGHSRRRTVYPNTIQSLTRKQCIKQIDRGRGPLLQYVITDEGLAARERYNNRKTRTAAVIAPGRKVKR